MNLCETCRHWNDRDYTTATNWGVCELSFSVDGSPQTTRSLAFGIDGDEYSAHLVTHHTFGCVQHEAQLAEATQ